MTSVRASWLHAFFHWWLGRLTELLPVSLRRPARQDIRFTVTAEGRLAPEEPAIPAQRATRAGRWLGTTARSDVALILPPGTILARDVSLPRAAAPYAAQTIGHDLDRLTPFRPEDVVWSVTQTATTPNGQIGFRLRVAPRRAFAPALESLQARGLTPTRLRTDDPDEVLALGRPRDNAFVRRPLLWGLAVAALAAPFLGQEIARLRVDHALDALSEPRARAEGLRHEIARLTQGPTAIRREEQRVGRSLDLLGALTRILPDNTFLTDLHIHNRHIDMEGQSAQATTLIGLLEHDAAFRNAAFTGPVTPTVDHRLDLFTLHVEAPAPR